MKTLLKNRNPRRHGVSGAALVLLCAALGLGLFLAARTYVPQDTGVPPARVSFQYTHNPMDNPRAAADIIVNPHAVYGFSPNPASKRLGPFAAAIDWTSSADVARARAVREAYHERNMNLWEIYSNMKAEKRPTEEIARAVSRQRNLNRLAGLDSKNRALTKASNLKAYGSEEGPTADSLYQKYGSWETVIDKAISTNPGMDACCGLYDDCYPLYQLDGKD
ncbi:MAG: hypothetical protein K5841_02030 [Fretibacterium sp.]|nr:hypothetical protein [Fretibacterium sp.]